MWATGPLDYIEYGLLWLIVILVTLGTLGVI